MGTRASSCSPPSNLLLWVTIALKLVVLAMPHGLLFSLSNLRSSILAFQFEVFIVVFCSTWVSCCVAFYAHFFLISNMMFSISVHHGILFLLKHLLWFFHDHLFLLFSPRSLVLVVISTWSTHHYALHGFLFLLLSLRSLH